MDESKFLAILDLVSDRAKDFVQVSDEVLRGEMALQARDGQDPSEWQVCSIISAFINFLAETERLRYGHYAFDLERKNNESRFPKAAATLGRMRLVWEHLGTEDVQEDQAAARERLIDDFLKNDAAIRDLLKTQPDLYQDGVEQEQHRDWMLRLRILGEREASLMRRWKELTGAPGPENAPDGPQLP